MRLCQEFLLGIGGVRMLRALGITPTVWHANEGHSAFSTLERIRELIQKGSTHADACETVRQSTVFTTHTPVPAGHDVFPHHLMDRYFAGYWEQLGLSREDFLHLGDTSESQKESFNMTALAIRLAAHVNGVSREHGQVSREMWHHMWPGLPIEQVPIRSVTNGIHAPTWIAPELNQLYGKYLGPGMGGEMRRHGDVATGPGYPRPGTLGRAPNHETQTHELHPGTCQERLDAGTTPSLAGHNARHAARPRGTNHRLRQTLCHLQAGHLVILRPRTAETIAP